MTLCVGIALVHRLFLSCPPRPPPRTGSVNWFHQSAISSAWELILRESGYWRHSQIILFESFLLGPLAKACNVQCLLQIRYDSNKVMSHCRRIFHYLMVSPCRDCLDPDSRRAKVDIACASVTNAIMQALLKLLLCSPTTTRGEAASKSSPPS